MCLPLSLSSAAAPTAPHHPKTVLQKRFLIIREEAMTLHPNLVCIKIRDSVNLASSSFFSLSSSLPLLVFLSSPSQVLFQLRLQSPLLYHLTLTWSPLIFIPSLPSLTPHPPFLFASITITLPFFPRPNFTPLLLFIFWSPFFFSHYSLPLFFPHSSFIHLMCCPSFCFIVLTLLLPYSFLTLNFTQLSVQRYLIYYNI